MKHDTIMDDDVLKEFSKQIGNLRYDLLCDFIRHLATKLHDDSIEDLAGGRRQLYSKLAAASTLLDETAEEIAEAWDLCDPKMPPGFENYDDDLELSIKVVEPDDAAQ